VIFSSFVSFVLFEPDGLAAKLRYHGRFSIEVRECFSDLRIQVVLLNQLRFALP
jgi:hypothetical protein